MYSYMVTSALGYIIISLNMVYLHIYQWLFEYNDCFIIKLRYFTLFIKIVIKRLAR